MTWWCAAAGGVAWTWEWRAYPGVWLLLLAMIFLWWKAVRPVPRARRPWASLIGGLLPLWLATDWPLGPLGAGYLASVHSMQFVLLAFVSAPLLILAVRPASPPPTIARVLHGLARPWVGLIAFNLVLFLTHAPAVVDRLMVSQLGNFAFDMAWLFAGIALWWPVLAPDGIRRIGGPLQILYLFVATIPPTIPAAFLTFAEFPLYGIYELAPRVHDISAMADQQAAGLLMKAVGDPILWIAMAIVFFRWHAAEERAETLHSSGSTA